MFSPKALLRHPKCKSDLNEFDDEADDQGIVGVRFKRLIMDDGGAALMFGRVLWWFGGEFHVVLPWNLGCVFGVISARATSTSSTTRASWACA